MLVGVGSSFKLLVSSFKQGPKGFLNLMFDDEEE